MQQIEDIETNWPEVGLSLSLESGETDKIVLGDSIRYRLSGNQLGSCYLLHVDSHGDATLLKPDRCDTESGTGGAGGSRPRSTPGPAANRRHAVRPMPRRWTTRW